MEDRNSLYQYVVEMENWLRAIPIYHARAGKESKCGAQQRHTPKYTKTAQ